MKNPKQYRWPFHMLLCQQLLVQFALWMCFSIWHLYIHNNFITSYIYKVANTHSLGNRSLLTDIFHCTMPQILHFLMSLLNKSENEQIESYQTHCDGISLPKTYFSAWKLQFNHWKQILLVIFLRVTSLAHSVFKEISTSTKVWIIIIYVSVK